MTISIFLAMILRNKDNQAEQNINRKRLSDREIDSVRRKEKRVGSNGLQWASKLPGKAGETRLTYNCAHLMSTKESLTI